MIEGKNGFRIIVMTRLTFVPFGLQNALFSVRRRGAAALRAPISVTRPSPPRP